jgi:hypothetical protein
MSGPPPAWAMPTRERDPAILAPGIPCAGSDVICPRHQVTTEPLDLRTIGNNGCSRRCRSHGPARGTI